jgi:ComEC/Rec2-related protein
MIVDGSASVLRAALMLILSQSAVLFGRKVNTLHGLCLAMFFCTLFTPYVIGAAGFWLSVSGVLGIGVIAPYMTEHLSCRKSLRHFLSLCCVSAAVFPASVLLLGQGSLIAPVSNLLILPFGILALYIGLFTLCTGGLTAFLLPLADPLCRALLTAAKYAAKIPFSHITVSTFSVRLTVILITILLLILLAMQISGKQIVSAFAVCCVILFGQIAYGNISARSMLQIAVLGKDKDTAAVMLCGGDTYIADLTGENRTPRYVRRFLEDRGITDVQLLLSPSQRSTAAYQAQTEHIENVYDLNTETEISAVRGAFSLCAESGSLHLSWNGITVEILPASDELSAEAKFIVRYGGYPQAEDRFVRRLSPALSADACIVPEYGGQNMLIRITEDGRFDIAPLS